MKIDAKPPSSESPFDPNAYLTNFSEGRGAIYRPGASGNWLVATYWQNDLEGTFTFAGEEPFLIHVEAFDPLEACKSYLAQLGKDAVVEAAVR